jgi:hypothetical protein
VHQAVAFVFHYAEKNAAFSHARNPAAALIFLYVYIFIVLGKSGNCFFIHSCWWRLSTRIIVSWFLCLAEPTHICAIVVMRERAYPVIASRWMPAAPKPSQDSADQLLRLVRHRHVTCPLLPPSAHSGIYLLSSPPFSVVETLTQIRYMPRAFQKKLC